MIPFDPNGVAVDLLRACYTTSIRPFFDSEYTEEIRYYFVDDKPVTWAPYSRFASGNYASTPDRWVGVGEVLGAPRPFSPGRRPFDPPVPGIAGNPEFFERGAPWAARGTLPRNVFGCPLPCAGGVFGLLLGGGGEFLQAEGGLLLGGGGIFEIIKVGDGGGEGNAAAAILHLVGAGGGEGNAANAAGLSVGDGGGEGNSLNAAGLTVGDGGGEGNDTTTPAPSIGNGGGEGDGGTPAGLDVGDGGGESDGKTPAGLDVGDGGGQGNAATDAALGVGDGGGEADGERVELLGVGDGGGEGDAAAAAALGIGDGGGEGNAAAAAALGVGDGGGEGNAEAAAALGVGDGGGEGNAEAAAALGVGDGGGEGNGEVGAASGGASCAAATPISLGVTYGATIASGATVWYSVAITNGQQYHLNCTMSGGLTSVIAGQRGTCPNPSTQLLWNRSSSGCSAATSTGTGTLYIRVIASGGSLTFSFSVDTGPC